jgi:23S rRNA (cytidine1920-2'-O)/16S rRNA (cytidine1409-2'-O)-methyltransferase
MASSYVRLDKLLVDSGLCTSRERAQALILAAKVTVDGKKACKAGQKVLQSSLVELVGDDLPYVSRGGVKLLHAIGTFGLELDGLVAMDVGASTGGFTDCLLQHGAARVYAVDVGYGQLAWKLRQDPRVVVIERSNIRTLPRDSIPEPVQVVSIDTSFISLRLVIPAVIPFMDAEATLIALIKPQFEAGRASVGKGGVVRDPRVHEEVCDAVAAHCTGLGFTLRGIVPSPILGPKGNREFLLVGFRTQSPL